MTQKFIRTLAWSAVAGALAALLISLALFLTERFDKTPRALLSSEMRVVKGAAVASNMELRLTGVDSEGVAMVIAPLGVGVPAGRYPSLRWLTDGSVTAQGYAVIWVTATQPQSLQSLPLTPVQFESGQVQLAADPRWQGDIVGLGLAILAPTALPMSIKSLTMDPAGSEWTWVDSSRYWAGRVMQFEPWLPSSINFYRGGLERSLISPVTLIVAWIMVSLVLVATIQWLSSQLSWRLAVLVIIVVGWLAIDFRWSLELLERMRSPPVDVRQYIGANAASWLEQLPDKFGSSPKRVFLIDDQSTEARALRARYLLSPHAVQLGFSDIPDAAVLRPGDLIVILSSPIAIRFDSKQKILFSASGRSTSASLVSAATGVGFAFQVDAALPEGGSP